MAIMYLKIDRTASHGFSFMILVKSHMVWNIVCEYMLYITLGNDIIPHVVLMIYLSGDIV